MAPRRRSEIRAHREAVVNGVRLHYVEAGAGPLVVLLHGFPEFWYAWRRQIGPLAAAGFRVLAPDLRGYNLSDKPRGVGRLPCGGPDGGRGGPDPSRGGEERRRRRPRLGRRPDVAIARLFP